MPCAVCMLIIKHYMGPMPLQFHELFMKYGTLNLEAQAQDHLESVPVRNLILFEIKQCRSILVVIKGQTKIHNGNIYKCNVSMYGSLFE